MDPLLSLKNVTVAAGKIKILDRISLDIAPAGITGIVGGSGSGKTTLGLSILKLLPAAMKMTEGNIFFNKSDLVGLNNDQMRSLRGNQIGVVFQEPLSAFDPLFTVGQQLDETLAAHTALNPAQRRERILESLQSVQIEDPLRIYRSYPHQLSGGLAQRAMIAQSLICRPKLIIADEPTSSLDVTIAAKIMELLRRLNKTQGIAMVLISHDLSMVAHLAGRVAVMSGGKIVEYAPAEEILNRPKDAYTKALMEAY